MRGTPRWSSPRSATARRCWAWRAPWYGSRPAARFGKAGGTPYTCRPWGDWPLSRRARGRQGCLAQGCGAIGSAAVSKTAGCRFESCRPCADGSTGSRTGRPHRAGHSKAGRSRRGRRGRRGQALDPRLTILRFDGRGREVANRKRRGEDAVDERLDDVVDEDALAEDEELLDDEIDEDLVEDEEDSAEQRSRARGNGRTGTVTKPKTAGAGKKAGPPVQKGVKVKEAERPGIIGRLVNFVREVVAELRKVIWPTRKELLTYTTVVIIFVTMMFVIVAGLDYGFARAALWVFGGGTK